MICLKSITLCMCFLMTKIIFMLTPIFGNSNFLSRSTVTYLSQNMFQNGTYLNWALCLSIKVLKITGVSKLKRL
jgi:hypothetical protein